MENAGANEHDNDPLSTFTKQPSSKKRPRDSNLLAAAKRSKFKDSLPDSHPSHFSQIRHCMCQNPSACRKIMARWLRIEGDGRFGYLHLPWEATRGKDTLNSRHVAAFREGVFRYLGKIEAEVDCNVGQHSVEHHNQHSYDADVTHESTLQEATAAGQIEDLRNNSASNELEIKQQSKVDNRIAFCHFHPKVIDLLLKEKEQYMLKRHRWRIPLPLAQEIGLQVQDMCPDPDENGERTCFALPNYPLESALADVEAAEQAYAQKVEEMKSSQTKLVKHITANPFKYALEIHNLREQNTRLAVEVKELKSKLKTEHATRCKIEQRNQHIDKRLARTKHRLVQVVESKKNPVPRGRPPKTDDAMPNNIPIPNIPGMMLPAVMGQQLVPNSILNEANYPNNLSSHDEKWEYRFRQLIEYRGNFHHCDVPRKWKCNKALGKWVSDAIELYQFWVKNATSREFVFR